MRNHKTTRSIHVMNWRNRTKMQLIAYKGGCCRRCGYSKPIPAAYAFHHVDPAEKEFNISGKSYSFERLRREADKCALLCCNCHAEVHHEWTAVQREERLLVRRAVKKLHDSVCTQCEKVFQTKEVDQRFCTRACAGVYSHRTVHPSSEELAFEVWQRPTTLLARQYGVSDKTIEKWCKKYEIQKPPRGYWTQRRYSSKAELSAVN
jgi:hypothetical protein